MRSNWKSKGNPLCRFKNLIFMDNLIIIGATTCGFGNLFLSETAICGFRNVILIEATTGTFVLIGATIGSSKKLCGFRNKNSHRGHYMWLQKYNFYRGQYMWLRKSNSHRG